MKRNVTILLKLTVCILAVNSCSFEKSEVSKTSDEVTSMFSYYTSDINKGKFDSIVNHFSNDTDFYWVEDGVKVYDSKDAMTESLQQFIDNEATVSMKHDPIEVTIHNANLATIYVSYLQDVSFKNGFKLELNGAMTALIKKEEGVWKFFQGHSSTKKGNNR